MKVLGKLNRTLGRIGPENKKADEDGGGGILGWLLDKTSLDEYLAEKASKFLQDEVGDFFENTLEPTVQNIVKSVQRQAGKVSDDFRDDLDNVWDEVFDFIIEPLLLALLNSLRVRAEEKFPQLSRTNADEGVMLVAASQIRRLSDIVEKAVAEDDAK